MLLLWHEALGSDDEQATEEELRARVLYSQDDSADGERMVQSLHLVQGLLTFVRMLRRSRNEEKKVETATSLGWRPEWASVTLSRRRFFILEVESQIFMALGVHPTIEIKEHKAGYEALLREVHGMFRLFFGSIDSNLRLLPSADQNNSEGLSVGTRKYTDGMDLLMDISTIRKRLRKLRLAIDFRSQSLLDHDDAEYIDHVMTQLEEDRLAAEQELEALLAQSPAVTLQKKCTKLFPTLLQALDARGTSGVSELQGIGYFPMDQPTFLALQSFVNSFHTEWNFSDSNVVFNKVKSSALFFKGNLLWSSMETTTLHLLYKFLRLREERGMTMIRDSETQAFNEPYFDVEPESELWMINAYDDTFLPVWSSKLSYAECDAVSQTEGQPSHLRKVARSLHKQRPVSLSTFMSDAPIPTSSSGLTPRSGIATGSSPFGSPSHSPVSSTRVAGPRSNGASPASSNKSAMKARARSISFRNGGLLQKNGCFLKLLHANRERLPDTSWDDTEAVWSPLIFPLDGSKEALIKHRVVVWHEADLTMLILFRLDGTELDSTDPSPERLKAATLERLENYLEGQLRFQSLAQLILTRYNVLFAPEKNAPNLHPLPPFLYINRVNLAFRMQHVPRLLKSKEDDLFPVPVKLLPHYFPASTLALVDELHAELHKSSSAGNREIYIRTRHSGWVLAKKSETSHRELYVFFDSKISSVYDLSDSLQMLLHDQFGNILL